jgi:hypothetical protein
VGLGERLRDPAGDDHDDYHDNFDSAGHHSTDDLGARDVCADHRGPDHGVADDSVADDDLTRAAGSLLSPR